MKIKDGEKVYNENIKTNINQKTTEMETTDDEGNTNVLFNDFKKVIHSYLFYMYIQYFGQLVIKFCNFFKVWGFNITAKAKEFEVKK